MKKLTADQIEKFRKQKHVFVRAQELTGVPWQAIAAVWMRETFSVSPPADRQGGQFQFDPPLTAERMQDKLDRYILPGKLTPEEKAAIIARGQESFPDAAILAACHMRAMCKFYITPNASDVTIKDAFYGYNGRAYGSADKSPYVMNYFDDKHWEMRVYGTVLDKRGRKIRVQEKLKDGTVRDGRPNLQLGAFTVYYQLRELKL